MKQIKEFLYKTAVVWMVVVVVGILFGLPSWSDLSVEWIKLRLTDAPALATVFVLAVAFVILSRLRYWGVWIGVLIVLAVMGSGIDLPHRFVFYPENLSIVHVSLTFIAILAFWVLEKLESKYVGSDISSVKAEDSLMEDEIITLNLADESPNRKQAESKN